MKRDDLYSGIVTLAFSIFVAYMTFQLPDSKNEVVGMKFFPGTMAASMAILGVYLIITSLVNAESDEAARREKLSIKPSYIIAGMTLIYLILIKYLGFIPTTPIFIAAATIFLRVNVKKAAVLSVLITAVIWFVFRQLLRVPLPTGMFY